MIGTATAIAGAIGAVGKLATSIVGGIKSSRLGKQAMGALTSAHSKATNMLNGMYNQDYINRSEIQGLLTNVRSALNDRYKRARATNIVAGGTDEALAMQQANDNATIASATAQAATGASAYKDKIGQAIISENNAYGQNMNAAYNNQAAQVANATAQANKTWDGLTDTAGSVEKLKASKAATQATT